MVSYIKIFLLNLLAVTWSVVRTEIYRQEAVATDTEICSKIGANILRKKGSAADAAIASIFCLGVVQPQSCGIGGGGFLIFYKRSRKKFYTYDFREVAPGNANNNMFNMNYNLSRTGALSISVPGEVKGLYTIYEKHGYLSWSELVQPAINLAENGFPMHKILYNDMKRFVQVDRGASYGLKTLFVWYGRYLRKGETLRNPELAKTLRNIQRYGSSDFYEGNLAAQIVNDIERNGGILTLKDLKNYKVKVREILQLKLPKDLTLNTMNLPGGGPLVAMILNIMKGYNFKNINLLSTKDQASFYHKLIESMKFSFAQRGLLGDPDFSNKKRLKMVLDFMTNSNTGSFLRERKITLDRTHSPSYYGGYWSKGDQGTSHVSILASNGDAISATGTLNYIFGSMYRSANTGMIFNNNMNDFSVPGDANFYGLPSIHGNYITPGKRALSSMSPTIITDTNGDVKLVIGASGGSRIISAIPTVILKTLYIGMPLDESVNSFRLHNQGVPNRISYYRYFPPPHLLLYALGRLGHRYQPGSKSVVEAIYKNNNVIYAVPDSRKNGKPAGY